MIIKNSNLRRALFSNRYKILAVIIAIILVLCLIQVFNQMAKISLAKEAEEKKNTVKNTYKPEQTIISGSDVPKNQQSQNSEVIKSFIQYCNNKEIQKAYDLLTEECKELVFSSKIENFQKNYVEKIFTQKRTYSEQSWVSGIGYTYKIKIMEDMLATGKIGNTVEDYYTIVKQGDNNKLNINGYIGRQEINKESEQDNIKMTILSKDVYKEYEIYNMKVQNGSDKTILLDSKQKTDTTYLKGENDKKYTAYMYELEDVRLTINARLSQSVRIRFYKAYTTSVKMTSVVFEDIIKDNTKYKSLENKKEYTDRLKLTIEL